MSHQLVDTGYILFVYIQYSTQEFEKKTFNNVVIVIHLTIYFVGTTLHSHL